MALTKADKEFIAEAIEKVFMQWMTLLDLPHPKDHLGVAGGYDGAVPYVDDDAEQAKRRPKAIGFVTGSTGTPQGG